MSHRAALRLIICPCHRVDQSWLRCSLPCGCQRVPPPRRSQSARELRERASDLTYNLDHDEAIRLLRQAIAADPNDPANHRALASTIWLQILFKRGAVTVDHYLGSFTKASVDVRNPPAELDAEFKREVAQAIEMAEQRVGGVTAGRAGALRPGRGRRPPGVLHRVGRRAAAGRVPRGAAELTTRMKPSSKSTRNGRTRG